jgi:hypothetical protein
MLGQGSAAGKSLQAVRGGLPDRGHHRPAARPLFYGTGTPACILVLDKENATTHHRLAGPNLRHTRVARSRPGL